MSLESLRKKIQEIHQEGKHGEITDNEGINEGWYFTEETYQAALKFVDTLYKHFPDYPEPHFVGRRWSEVEDEDGIEILEMSFEWCHFAFGRYGVTVFEYDSKKITEDEDTRGIRLSGIEAEDPENDSHSYVGYNYDIVDENFEEVFGKFFKQHKEEETSEFKQYVKQIKYDIEQQEKERKEKEARDKPFWKKVLGI